MADINITQLTSYADPKSTDELPIVDLVADVTKRVTLAKLLQNANPGTAAAPGITFDGRAANTGIYSQNDYHIGLATNGVSRVHCRENGYVGINKEAPTAPFDVVGNSVITGTLSVTEATSLGGNLTVTGDLTVNGTTTTVNSTTLTVDDKNIELGSVAAPTNATADGGGITLRGSTNKTWNWVNSTSSWTSSEHINLASGNTYKINGVEVLSATALASAVKITSDNISDGTIVNADISASAEIAVSKLADGAARQVLQTDAAGTGVEWTSNVDLPGTLDVTGNVTFDSNLTIAGNLTVNGTTTTINSTTLSVDDKNIELGSVASPTDVTANAGGITLKGATDKTLNWVSATGSWTSSENVDLVSGKTYKINGTDVLSSSGLGSGVTSSSLTSVGTIATGVWQGTAIADAYLDTISTAGKVSNSATTATSANTASAIVARDGTGNFSAGTITAALTGNADTATALSSNRTFAVTGDVTGTVSSDLTAGASIATSIAAGVIVNDDINASAAIADTKLATISTAGKVSNSATTATNANTANAIVARDASGDFSAGTVTADLTGNASTATTLSSARTFALTGDITGTVDSDLSSGASITTSIGTGVIVNANVSASAAIAGTKISPDFGSQNIATTGNLNIDSGLLSVNSASNAIGFYSATPVAQPSAITNITSTATSGSLPTPDGSVTIADATAPTVTELLEYCTELEAKLETALGALRTLGLIAT